MVMGLGMRTIWISLRAMNYTDRAFRAAIGNLDQLDKKEKAHLKNLLLMKDAARMNVAVGMLYAAMAGMMAQSLFSFISTTEVGAEYMREFTGTLDEAKVALADTFFETMRPVLDVIKTFLELIRDNAPLRYVVVILASLATVLLGLYGVYKLVMGIKGGIAAARRLNIWLAEHELILAKKQVASNTALSASSMTLGTALAYVAVSAALGFAVFFALKDTLGPLPAMILAVAVALIPLVVMLWKAGVAANILTGGLLAIGGLAALGGALGMMNMAGLTNFQMGTRSAPYTGPMMVHRGEVIYNPYTERPTGIAAELRRGAGPSITHQKIEIGIEHLHTEAPFDEVEEKMGRTLRKNMRNSR